jgi:hypothetical protein
MNGNKHCGKHDKIFTEANPCPGCVNEAAGEYVSSAQQSAEDAAAENETATEEEETGGEETGGETKMKKGRKHR